MQLRLGVDQLNLLADVLLERVGEISSPAASAGRRKTETDAKQQLQRLNELLEKVLAHDLRLDSDELEQLASLLADKKGNLRTEIAQQPNAALKKELQRKLKLLEEVLEHVSEACVMI